jgi:hypothetical protein
MRLVAIIALHLEHKTQRMSCAVMEKAGASICRSASQENVRGIDTHCASSTISPPDGQDASESVGHQEYENPAVKKPLGYPLENALSPVV